MTSGPPGPGAGHAGPPGGRASAGPGRCLPGPALDTSPPATPSPARNSGLCCACLQAKETARAERPTPGRRGPGWGSGPRPTAGRVQQQRPRPRLLPRLQQLSRHVRLPSWTAHAPARLPKPLRVPQLFLTPPVSPPLRPPTPSDAGAALGPEPGSLGSSLSGHNDPHATLDEPRLPSCASVC